MQENIRAQAIAVAIQTASLSDQQIIALINSNLSDDGRFIGVNEPVRKGRDITTLLIMATKGKRFAVVQRLLAVGADPNFSSPVTGVTPLIEAIGVGRSDIVGVLLAAGADPNFLSPKMAVTPLIEAIESGQAELVRVLLAAGADLNLLDATGMSPLIKAIENGRDDIVKILFAASAGSDAGVVSDGSASSEGGAVRRGANPNLIAAGNTPLTRAVQTGQPKMVELLLAQGADPNLMNEAGDTPLLLAAQAGQLEMVRLLLDRGADPRIPNRSGVIPLMMATPGESDEHSEIVGILLNHPTSGEQLQAKDHENKTAKMYLTPDEKSESRPGPQPMKRGPQSKKRGAHHKRSSSSATIIKFLEKEVLTPVEGVEFAAQNQDPVLANHLLSRQSKESIGLGLISELTLETINDPVDGQGNTLLINAIERGELETVKMLLLHGANPTLENKKGVTPLMMAVSKNHSEMVEVLLKSLVEKLVEDPKVALKEQKRLREHLNAQDKEGQTALMYAAKNGNEPIFRQLTEAGAPLGSRMTKESFVIAKDQADKKAVERESQKNLEDLQGNTLLEHAITGGNREIITFLLAQRRSVAKGGKKKFKVNHKDSGDRTPLMRAVKNLDLVKQLVKEGADPRLADKSGMTALAYAATMGYTDTISYLLSLKGLSGKRKLNIDQGSALTGTALSLAAVSGRLEAVEALVAEGANLGEDPSGNTALLVCLEAMKEPVKDKDPRSVEQKVSDGMQCANFLISQMSESQLNVVKQDSKSLKKTAILTAVEVGQYEMVASLVDRGANINLSNPPLLEALFSKSGALGADSLKLARLLMERGAEFPSDIKDIEKKDKSGNKKLVSKMDLVKRRLQEEIDKGGGGSSCSNGLLAEFK